MNTKRFWISKHTDHTTKAHFGKYEGVEVTLEAILEMVFAEGSPPLVLLPITDPEELPEAAQTGDIAIHHPYDW
jgi:hypothetical protein